MLRVASAFALVCLLPVVVPVQVTAEPDERALLQLWEKHVEHPDDHKTIIQDCIAFKRSHPSDPLVAVTTTLAAWHVLKLEMNQQALSLLAPYLEAEGAGLIEGANIMARTWASRMDREQVKSGLQYFYKKEVKYPGTLGELAAFEGLPAELKPIARDRFDQPWKYKLAGFKSIPGLFDQKYELESGKLGIDSDLKQALAFPYGERMHITPVALKSADTLEVVRGRSTEGPKMMVSVGRKIDDVLFAFAGREIIILCDRDHWTVMKIPGRL
jgi:hypothetical protein